MIVRNTLPDVVFKTRVHDESIAASNPYRWQDLTTDEIFDADTLLTYLKGTQHPIEPVTRLAFEG